MATAAGRTLHADLAITTLGHRPPGDEFSWQFKGPRNRFIADPWAALVLSQIGPDEPVLLLGSGLTAVDAFLTLDRSERTAPLTVVSRRGLLPLPHARAPKAADDVAEMVTRWLDPAKPLIVRDLVRELRGHVARAALAGVDWRQAIDGLRPSIARLWERLNLAERARFLEHVRPFWEIHRHRMAPDVAARLEQLRRNQALDVTAGTLLAAEADDDGSMSRSNAGAPPPRGNCGWLGSSTAPGPVCIITVPRIPCFARCSNRELCVATL